MVRALALAATLAAVLGACGYGASFRDCTIGCADESGCPNTFACGAEGLCRAPGSTDTCSAVLGDAGSIGDANQGDASPDGPPRDVTLTETTDTTDVTTAGFTCMPCPTFDGQETFPLTLNWYREFSLSDFAGSPWNVAGSFHITAVHVGCSSEVGKPTITATVYNYSGTLFQPTIADGLTQIGQGSTQVQSCTNDIAIPIPSISQDVDAGGAFVVAISVVEMLEYDANIMPSCSIDPSFHIGANSSGDSHASYYESPTSGCASGSASSTPTTWTSNAVLIGAEGITN